MPKFDVLLAGLTLDDRMEIHRYEAFRTCRRIRDKVCKDREGKKFLTRVMRRLKESYAN